ncbi:MAG: hypothetical protein ACT6FC_06370, partial [Methanosarcinaceae archaeon]
MKNYFIDYEIYSNGLRLQWGNLFATSDTIDFIELANEIKEEILKGHEQKFTCENIRFRQFNV